MRRLVVAAVVAAFAAGCGDDEESTASIPAGCESAAAAPAVKAPAALPRPGGNVRVSATREQDGRTIVEGFVDRTPSDALADLAGRDELKVLDREDEGDDAEVTVSDGKNRTAYKLVKACEGGSRFSAVIAAE